MPELLLALPQLGRDRPWRSLENPQSLRAFWLLPWRSRKAGQLGPDLETWVQGYRCGVVFVRLGAETTLGLEKLPGMC